MSERDGIGPDGLTDQQRAAGYAPRKHSVAAGQRQPALAEPLTEAEFAHPRSEGYGPAITDVDCTPRPRYGESQAKFLARMRGYGLDMEALKADVRQRNRAAALRWIDADGLTHKGAEPTARHGQIVAYWTQCACGWCGLRVADPEVARREYDAHACAAETIGDDAVSRAQAHAGRTTMPAKRTTSVLKPALGEQRMNADDARSALAEADADAKITQQAQDLDEASQRFALLELGKP